VAHLKPGATVATREPGLLFKAPLPDYSSAVLDNTTLYLFSCTPGAFASSNCRVVRAPLGQATAISAYRAWNGSAWVADLSKAAVVTNGGTTFSVSWNEYLQRYVAVYLGLFSTQLSLRTAPRPEGPWSEPLAIGQAAAPAAGGYDYAAFQHGELSSESGRTIYVSYSRPTTPFKSEIRIVRMRFGSASQPPTAPATITPLKATKQSAAQSSRLSIWVRLTNWLRELPQNIR
jgi:hypothetical protein